MKVAHVYDWLINAGGGEKTLDAICEIFPADIHTLVHDASQSFGPHLKKELIRTSFLQKFPFATRLYRHYLPFFPLAVEQFDLSAYDVVISTSHAVAKGALTNPQQLHLCYCFTPMRYAWDLTHHYLEDVHGLKKAAARMALHYLRNWDVASVSRVDHFAVISHHVAKRVKKNYGRDSTVIYPPVDTARIPYCDKKENFFLTASRMVPYKKIDMIVEAFSHLPAQQLVVIGDGPEMKKIRSKAGKNVTLLGYQSDAVLHDYLGRAKGFIYAAEEDFGIAVVEAQAAGTPVIAFGKGACLETVVERKTGIFYPEQNVHSLVSALNEYEKIDFDYSLVRKHAEQFNRKRFQEEFKQFVEMHYKEHHESSHSCRW